MLPLAIDDIGQPNVLLLMHNNNNNNNNNDNNNNNRERFGSIEEASSFWKELWEAEGSGNSQAVWLEEVRHAIFTKVPPPTDEDWTLETTEAVGVLKRKKNWSAP